MSGDPIPVTVTILDKEYMISCPPEEKDGLLEAARYLNDRMRQVRDSGKVLGSERMAVITALNVIHEFMREAQLRTERVERFDAEIRRLEDRVEQATPRRTVAQSVD